MILSDVEWLSKIFNDTKPRTSGRSATSARIVKKDLGGLDSSAEGTRFEAP